MIDVIIRQPTTFRAGMPNLERLTTEIVHLHTIQLYTSLTSVCS